MSVTIEAVKTALSNVIDPNTGKDLISSKCIKNIQLDGTNVAFDVELGYPAKSQFSLIRSAAIAALSGIAGNVSANVYSKIQAHSRREPHSPHPQAACRGALARWSCRSRESPKRAANFHLRKTGCWCGVR